MNTNTNAVSVTVPAATASCLVKLNDLLGKDARNFAYNSETMPNETGYHNGLVGIAARWADGNYLTVDNRDRAVGVIVRNGMAVVIFQRYRNDTMLAVQGHTAILVSGANRTGQTSGAYSDYKEDIAVALAA